jgi:UPF0755 protein
MTDLYDQETPDEGQLPDDDEYVELPRERRWARRLGLVLLALLVVLLLVAGVAGVYLARQINPPGPPGEVVAVEVPVGSSTTDIGKLLAGENVITSATIWRYYVRQKGAGPFQAGRYEFRRHSSMGDAIGVLEAGAALPEFTRVTVPEGYTVPEILARLADPDKGVSRFSEERLAELLRHGQVPSAYRPADQPSYEGLLFPETYRIEAGEDEAAVLTKMTAQLESVMQAAGVDTAQARLGLTPYEVVIVASLIEEEAKVPEDAPKIARVIYNRLKQGIPLGVDATSRYEAVLAGRDRSKVDFTSTSHYNTRRIAGLPPTPIASPGRASIEAALNPADGPWIYYVLQDKQGHHFFTESAKEFQRAKAECKRNGLGCG